MANQGKAPGRTSVWGAGDSELSTPRELAKACPKKLFQRLLGNCLRN